MLIEEQEDRIAILLSLLGKEVTGPLIEQLPEDPQKRVRELIGQYEADPLDDEEVDEVIDEFMRMLRFANQQGEEEKAKDAASKNKKKPPVIEETEDDEDEFIQTDDAVADLLRLEAFQIAGALKSEQPRTIALVLNCMPPAQAGDALQNLPIEMQGEVFLFLKEQPTAPQKLLDRIVRSTVEKGCVLDANSISDPEEEIFKNLAELLRAMGKTERTNIMDSMQEHDPDSMERLTKMLFIFEDVLTLTDRCIQKILGEVDTSTIAKAIKNAEPPMQNKFLDNLSKRAKATLVEEMEYMDKIKEEDEAEAQDTICQAMAQLDQSGELETMDD